ncbi:DUF4386 domain-containing protein [Pengzhenrongella frigida]|uniref:DUF4386 domain-containing protein n=2 Tax=Pengzhenrongella frigida TaxID=1259133 RepID=A0A4Q5N5Q3_9MICO|nr:DUF4386 domain-containing protein [Cellulomonas sp. HLT2-17]
MAPIRRTALLAGALYLITFLASIPAAAYFLLPVLDDPRYILGPGQDARVTIGALLDIINALACIGTAVVLYPVVRRTSPVLALGFLASRILEAAIIVAGVMALLAVVTLRRDVAGDPGADADSLLTVGAALIAVRDWSFLFGPGLAVANALLLGTFMYRSRLVPRVIPLMGLIGAPLLLASNLGTMFGINEQLSVLSLVAVPGIFFWELTLGIYLIVKGFTPPPTITGVDGDRQPSSFADVP